MKIKYIFFFMKLFFFIVLCDSIVFYKNINLFVWKTISLRDILIKFFKIYYMKNEKNINRRLFLVSLMLSYKI